MLLPERSPNEGIKHTIGFGTLRFGERVDHKADCELPFITLHHCTLTQGTWISSLDARIMSNRTMEDGLRQLDETRCIKREAFQLWHMVRARVGGCILRGSLIFYRGNTYTTLEPTLKEMHDPLLERHSKVSQEHLQRLVDLTCRWRFGLHALFGIAFGRQDDRSHYVVWPT